MRYLLDSDILSEFQEPSSAGHSTLAAKLSSLKDSDAVAVSILTIYELEYGCAKAPEDKRPEIRKRIDVAQKGELLTAVKYGMSITHVLLNNSELGKISKEQRAGNWRVWQTSLHNPSFAAYAEFCGALGIRVTREDELDDALARALAHAGPSLVEIVSDPDLV